MKIRPILKDNIKVDRFILIILIIIFLFLALRRLTMFLLLTAIVGAFTYLNYHIRFPFDISPVLFISLVISREYSFLHSLVFVLIAGVAPMVLAGGSFDITTIFYVSVRLFVNYINTLLTGVNFLIAFIGLSVADHVLGTIGSITLFGAKPHKEIVNLLAQTAVDLFYIFTFAGFLISLIR